MRWICSLMAMAAVAGASATVTHGFVKLAYGKVLDPNGQIRDVSGLMLPYTAESIDAVTLRKSIPVKASHDPTTYPKGWPRGPMFMANQSIYQADQQLAGSSEDYAVVDWSFPSCNTLDDITPLPGSVGKQWKYLTWGMDAQPNAPSFLVRYTAFQAYVPGRGADVSAFDPWPVSPSYKYDFGFVWPNWVYTTPQKITVDVSSAQVWAPTDTIYFRQQYRTTLNIPNGDFREDVRPVFNQVLPPQIGSSAETYFQDFNEDGILDETEADVIGDESSQLLGNYLLNLEISSSGTTNEIQPFSVTPDVGSFESGNAASLWFIDGNNLVMKPASQFAAGRNPRCRAIVTSFSPTSTPTSFTGSCTFSATTSVPFKMEWYKYTSPAGWVEVANGTAGPTETTLSKTWTAGQLSQFVHSSDGEIKMRISAKPNPFIPRTWRFKMNQVHWTIGSP